MKLTQRWQHELESLNEQGRFRTLAPPAGLDFSSNDYLGYSKRVWPARQELRSGTASRLLRGQHPVWEQVEAQLAAWHGADAALMFTSGYAANEGLLSTVIQPGDTVFSDQYNHASIIDGLRLSGADKAIFAHNDMNQLEGLMNEKSIRRDAGAAWFVVTESLFGMEGDRAPLRELATLAERHEAHLIVDEAHATGCFGPTGSGLVDALGLRERVLATIHTGGKALAVPGAYLAGSRLLKDWLVNRCRHFIFTTALAPALGAWWLDMLELVRADAGTRQRLHHNAGRFRSILGERGIDVSGTDYLVSLMIGRDAPAVDAARRLQASGFDIRAIRPPTVPAGTARLRISIHADHELDSLSALSAALAPTILESA
ncbi:MAG: 8-amino-7-oxononanoate synthase [Planctomycetes bacterium]|nr:8-amino-7-oxononanoate synthase [Planctomycetota bacterium]